MLTRMCYICAGHAQQCFAQANDAVYGAAAWAIIEMQKTKKLAAGEKKLCMSQVTTFERTDTQDLCSLER